MDNREVEMLAKLAESSQRRAKALHSQHLLAKSDGDERGAASLLNDFFYWSGKGTAYRGIVAMVGLQRVVDEEIEGEGACP